MDDKNYLSWIADSTDTAWWHDSGDPGELDRALAHGAVGVTTNPVICARALDDNRELWGGEIEKVLSRDEAPGTKAESLMRIVVTHAAGKLEPIHRSTGGSHGYVCAQVNPSLAADRESMYAMAKRFNAWAPNIAIKLPATAAGLDVMEKICAEGIAATITVSFSLPQVYATARRYQEVVKRRKDDERVGRCFAVVMIGRLDDYLREVFGDNDAGVSEEVIQAAGLSVVKRAYSIYQESKYDAVLLIAALRGNYHMTELAGGKLIMSIAPPNQQALLDGVKVFEERIDEKVSEASIDVLKGQPEFIKAFEPDGLSDKELITFGPTQRTLSQFTEVGWKLLEGFKL